jgi:hypothetical protein
MEKSASRNEPEFLSDLSARSTTQQRPQNHRKSFVAGVILSHASKLAFLKRKLAQIRERDNELHACKADNWACLNRSISKSREKLRIPGYAIYCQKVLLINNHSSSELFRQL